VTPKALKRERDESVERRALTQNVVAVASRCLLQSAAHVLGIAQATESEFSELKLDSLRRP